jgi:predicted nucleic acid-binding protein
MSRRGARRSSATASAATRDRLRHWPARRRCPSTDDDHYACVELFTGLHLARRELLVPAPVVAEVGYLLQREPGADVEALFLDSLAEQDLTSVELTTDDYRRAADLVRQYRDLPLGTTDACVIAITERLRLTEVTTLDRRHFSVARPAHVNALTLLP